MQTLHSVLNLNINTFFTHFLTHCENSMLKYFPSWDCLPFPPFLSYDNLHSIGHQRDVKIPWCCASPLHMLIFFLKLISLLLSYQCHLLNVWFWFRNLIAFFFESHSGYWEYCTISVNSAVTCNGPSEIADM